TNIEERPSTDPYNAQAGYTIVTLDKELGTVNTHSAENNIKVYAMKLRATLFGYNAPDWKLLPESVKKNFETSQNNKVNGLIAKYYSGFDFNIELACFIDKWINLDAKHTSWFSVEWDGYIKPVTPGQYIFQVTVDYQMTLKIGNQDICWNKENNKTIAFWNDGELESEPFNFEPERYYWIKVAFRADEAPNGIKLKWKKEGEACEYEIISQGELFLSNEIITESPDWENFTINGISKAEDVIHLDSVYAGIVPGSLIVLSTADDKEVFLVTDASEDSRTGFTLSSKTTRLGVGRRKA
ncbi:MAG: hypothetical protein IPG76_18430, partial [Acidobacteria bacterium]|nr:hypothetical protein [Acidobacteriota bacterium]